MKPCKIIKTDLNNPYPRIYREGKRWKLSRYIYSKFHNIDLDEADEIMHICDNPGCYEITHLKLGTHKDNMKDMSNKNRTNTPTGENNHMTEMTEEKVLELRELFRTGKYSKAELGRIFHITDVSAGHIIKRKTWKHI